MVSPTSLDTAHKNTNLNHSSKIMNSHTASNNAQTDTSPNPTTHIATNTAQIKSNTNFPNIDSRTPPKTAQSCPPLPPTPRFRRICFCNPRSNCKAYMEPLISCSNKRCRPRWYHERCVGMDLMPYLPLGWYCHQCKHLAPPIPPQDGVCVCDTPPYVNGPLRECAKREECRVRWFHYPCTRAQYDDGGEWVCKECERKAEEEDEGYGEGEGEDGGEREDEGDADSVSGADKGGFEEGDGVAHGTAGVLVPEDDTAQATKRKRDDDDEAPPAEKKRITGVEVGKDEVALGRSPSPEPELSLKPEVEFCICATPASDNMVGCDGGAECAHQWFHFECVGMTEATVPEGEWFCEECAERRGRGGEKE